MLKRQGAGSLKPAGGRSLLRLISFADDDTIRRTNVTRFSVCAAVFLFFLWLQFVVMNETHLLFWRGFTHVYRAFHLSSTETGPS